MTQCSLCGAYNAPSASTCHLCETKLIGDESDDATAFAAPASKRSPRLKWLISTFCLMLLVVIPWLLMSDLFADPEDAVVSRKHYFELTHNYYAKKEKWDTKKSELIAKIFSSPPDSLKDKELWINNIPLEVAYAYLSEEIAFNTTRFNDAALYPSENARGLILSKYEHNVWPFRILLSLEIELINEEGILAVKFLQLRRGTRIIPEGLAWVYFGSELQALKGLDALQEKITKLKLAPAKSKSPTEFVVSLAYQHASQP